GAASSPTRGGRSHSARARPEGDPAAFSAFSQRSMRAPATTATSTRRRHSSSPSLSPGAGHGRDGRDSPPPYSGRPGGAIPRKDDEGSRAPRRPHQPGAPADDAPAEVRSSPRSERQLK